MLMSMLFSKKDDVFSDPFLGEALFFSELLIEVVFYSCYYFGKKWSNFGKKQLKKLSFCYLKERHPFTH